MAFIFKKDIISNNNCNFLYEFKEFMKLSSPNGPGWNVKLSSNGSVFGVGDNISSSQQMLVSNAWFVLQDPSGNREFLFQHTSSGVNFIIKYSASVGFLGGGASTLPTASDQKIIFSNSAGTSGDVWIKTGSDMFNTIIGADDSDGYSFFMLNYNSFGSSFSSGLFMDEMLTGSYSVSDTDPVIIGVFFDISSSNFNSISTANNVNKITCWKYKDTASASFTVVPILFYSYANASSYFYPLNYPIDNVSGKKFVFPAIYCKQNYFKGIGKNFKLYKYPFGSVDPGNTNSSYPCRFSVNSYGDYISFFNMLFPWNGEDV